MDAFSIALYVGEVLDLFGVFVILFGVILSTVIFIKNIVSRKNPELDIYKNYRTNLGRGILLGLEILVAGDIIRSVVGHPTFTSIGILALIVLIRSFLSITFDMEINNRWPWQKKS